MCVCICVYACTLLCPCQSMYVEVGGKLDGAGFFSYHVRPGDCTLVLKFWGKPFTHEPLLSPFDDSLLKVIILGM